MGEFIIHYEWLPRCSPLFKIIFIASQSADAVKVYCLSWMSRASLLRWRGPLCTRRTHWAGVSNRCCGSKQPLKSPKNKRDIQRRLVIVWRAQVGMRGVMNHVNGPNWFLTHRHINTCVNTCTYTHLLRVAACTVTTGRGMMILQDNEPCMTVASGLTRNTVAVWVCVCGVCVRVCLSLLRFP